jgi:serine/threonine protein kinase
VGKRYGDRFEATELLGQGAMGKVFRARDAELGREVALKVVPARQSGTSLERFRREGEVTASLRHPGIVGVHSSGQEGDEAYLAYELIPEARTLRDAIAELDRRASLELLIGAAEALGYAHQRGVIHRDVKPDNILVTARNEPKVADFGLAMAQGQERLTRTGALVGTPYYMAPEQFDQSQKHEVGPPADVWALGVILFELLTGSLPFDGNSILELGAQIMRGSPPLPSARQPDLPRELDAIYLQALRPSPSERYADGQALADDLRRFLAGERLSAEQPGWSKARALRWGGLGLGLAILAVGVTLGVLSLRPPAPDSPGASAPGSEPRSAPRYVSCGWRLEAGGSAREIELSFSEDRDLDGGSDWREATLRRIRLGLEGEVPLSYDTERDRWLPLNAVIGRSWSSTATSTGPGPLRGVEALQRELKTSLVDAASPLQALVAEGFYEPQLRRHLVAARALKELDGSAEQALQLWPEAGIGLSCALSVTREGDRLEGRLTGWERLEDLELSAGARRAGIGRPEVKVREPELSYRAALEGGVVVKAELELRWREAGGDEVRSFRLRYASQPEAAGVGPSPSPNSTRVVPPR